MAGQPTDYGREVRETIVKSGLTGVAATVLAVTIFSPAGFGGMIGTSLASGVGLGSNSGAADDPYALLPAFPTPLTPDELSDIRGELARTTASLEITRAATQAKIEHIRSIALTEGTVTFAPMQPAEIVRALPSAASQPLALAAPAETNAAEADNQQTALAELMLAHEAF